MAFVLLIFLLVAPFLVGLWCVRTMQRFPGVWRRTAAAPLVLDIAAVLVAGHGLRTEGAHATWPFTAIALLVLASLFAYILAELRQAAGRRTSIPTAPLN